MKSKVARGGRFTTIRWNGLSSAGPGGSHQRTVMYAGNFDMRTSRRTTVLIGVLVAVGALGAAPTVGEVARAASRVSSAPYSLAASTRCLRANGATVARVQPRNARLRALRDLAQRTSREVRVGSRIVGIAFVERSSDAELLIDLLRVPSDPYRLQRRQNVIMMARPRDRRAAALVTSCLRPRP